MKLIVLIFFYVFTVNAQQTIDKLNANQLKLPKESVNRALILDSTGQVKSSSTVSDTELSYLDGLTDTLLNLLSGKANDTDVVKLTGDQSISGVKTFTGKLVASSTVNGSTPCPVMNETQRNSFTAVQGDCVFNSTSLKLNVYDGAVWKDVGGAGGVSLWLTANPYLLNDVVIESDRIYRCLIAHTSGTFATDLAANRWVEVSASPTTPYSLANGGTNKALTASNGGVVWVDVDSFEILGPGTSGQILQSNAAASPSWVNKSISAKAENAAGVTLEEIQVSNNQLTETASNKHKVETGNKNILVNPSFEHSTFSTGWTNSAGTFAEDLVVEVDGLKTAKVTLTAQALALHQDSTLYQAQFADGIQGLAMVRVKTSVAGLRVCSRQNAVITSNLCVAVQANGKWGLYKVPFTLGGTSNGISINSNGNTVTGDVFVDDAFLGAVDLSATVDQSRVAVQVYFDGATCNWPRTNTAIGAFTATAGCPGPTIEYSSLGTWATTDTDLPKITATNAPAGVYKVTALVRTALSTTATAGIAINDGTTTCQPQNTSIDGANSQVSIITCIFNYASSGARSFELYSRVSSGTVTVANSATGQTGLRFVVEYYGSGTTYSSTNADTDWAACGHTTSDFTGFGTVSVIETQCKREGSDLLMRGRFTSTSPTAVEARLNLKFAGQSLTSAGSSVIPSLQVTGNGAYNAAGNNYYVSLIEPSVGYMTFGIANSTLASFSKATGTGLVASGFALSFTARIPIAGWQNSNIIIGQFNGLESCTNTLECTDTFSAKVSAARVVSDENVNFINGNCTSGGTGVTTCTYVTGVFTVTPNCTGTNSGDTSVEISSQSSSSITVRTRNSVGTSVDSPFTLSCQKQGVDYIGKTAKAVASDQNVRSVGATRVDVQAVQFGSGANCASVCSTGNCTICNQAGSKITSISFVAAGVYNVNGLDGTKYVCTGGASVPSNPFSVPLLQDRANSTSSLVRISSSNQNSSFATLTCHGADQ